MAQHANLTPEQEKKLLAAFQILAELADHELPAVRFGCRKAKNELWQTLFDLDLVPS